MIKIILLIYLVNSIYCQYINCTGYNKRTSLYMSNLDNILYNTSSNDNRFFNGFIKTSIGNYYMPDLEDCSCTNITTKCSFSSNSRDCLNQLLIAKEKLFKQCCNTRNNECYNNGYYYFDGLSFIYNINDCNYC